MYIFKSSSTHTSVARVVTISADCERIGLLTILNLANTEETFLLAAVDTDQNCLRVLGCDTLRFAIQNVALLCLTRIFKFSIKV